MSSIFLSHSHADKAFVRKLAADLRRAGARVWVDEAEIQIGDSLIEKIRQGIDEMEYVGAILSPSSIASKWVQRELDVAMNQEIDGKQIKVLPIMLHECAIPGFLVGKLYADFRDAKEYSNTLVLLLKRLGIETKLPPADSSNLFTLLSAAIASREEDLTRKAVIGFLNLPEGGHHSLVCDVLGSISSYAKQSENNTAIELSSQAIIDTFIGLGSDSLNAVQYLLDIPHYFQPPPKVLAQGILSPHIGVRLACNLAVYGYHHHGNSSDAEVVAGDKIQPTPFRVAAIHSLGLAAHVDAAAILNQVANDCELETAPIHSAIVDAAYTLGLRAAPSQVLDAFVSIFMCVNVASKTRKFAAIQFLKIEENLRERVQRKYDAVRATAISLRNS